MITYSIYNLPFTSSNIISQIKKKIIDYYSNDKILLNITLSSDCIFTFLNNLTK